jgi:hypothetical protein
LPTQQSKLAVEEHMHTGFALSMTAGLAFAPVTQGDAAALSSKTNFGKPIPVLDGKFGYACWNNVILSCDLRMENNPGASSTFNGFWGLGVTDYVMPANYFLSLTVALSAVTIKNSQLQAKSIPWSEFSFQVKIGKEWWVSSEWGIGIAAGVASLKKETDQTGCVLTPSTPGNTTHVFVLCTTTFN